MCVSVGDGGGEVRDKRETKARCTRDTRDLKEVLTCRLFIWVPGERRDKEPCDKITEEEHKQLSSPYLCECR